MASPFAVSGLASGVDTQTLIAQLMAVARRPLTKVQDQQKTTENRSTILADLTSRLATLKAKLTGLTTSSTLNAKLVSTDVSTSMAAPATVTASTWGGTATST